MRHSWRNIIALGFSASVMMGLVLPGCSNRLEPVLASQSRGGIGHPELQDVTVAKGSECMAEFGRQLERGYHEFDMHVDVNEDGGMADVTIEGIPNTAYDLGACLRNVFRTLPIAEQPFREGLEMLEFHRKHARDSQEALVRFINVIPGVPIVESELVLKAEGYTIAVDVTVKVVAKLSTLLDMDKATLEKIGQMALDMLGYDEIMNRAEEQGWIKTVPDEQAQSSAAKQFIGDVSLSPTPQPPVRPPPPTGVIAKTATKRIVTKAAPRVVAKVLPAAAAAAAADGPVPVGDVIAVGIVVVALVVEHGLAPEEVLVLGGGQAHRVTAAASAAAAPSSAATTTAQPAPTLVKPRKYPNQTCEEDVRIRLEAAKKAVCPEKPQTFPGRSCHHKTAKEKALAEKYPCSLIRARIAAINTCVAARQKVQDVCFKGSPDTGHPQQIDDLTRGNSLCEALKAINCAPGHPMSGL